jgi:hypothetical protein
MLKRIKRRLANGWARSRPLETSVPSVVIATHMSNMGAVQALAFVGPLLYFVFIILSTLRLDLRLSAGGQGVPRGVPRPPQPTGLVAQGGPASERNGRKKEDKPSAAL